MNLQKVMQVGEVSQKLGINTQTLYFYERIGLIPPPRRSSSGYRLFDERDIERLNFISQTKALGLTLDEIKEILMFQDGQLLTCRDFHTKLTQKVAQIENKIEQLQQLRDRLRPLIERCHNNLESSTPSDKCVVLETISDESKENIIG